MMSSKATRVRCASGRFAALSCAAVRNASQSAISCAKVCAADMFVSFLSTEILPGCPSAEPLRQLHHGQCKAALLSPPRLTVERQSHPSARHEDRDRLPPRSRQLRRKGGKGQRHLRIRELVEPVERLAAHVELPARHRLKRFLHPLGLELFQISDRQLLQILQGREAGGEGSCVVRNLLHDEPPGSKLRRLHDAGRSISWHPRTTYSALLPLSSVG